MTVQVILTSCLVKGEVALAVLSFSLCIFSMLVACITIALYLSNSGEIKRSKNRNLAWRAITETALYLILSFYLVINVVVEREWALNLTFLSLVAESVWGKVFIAFLLHGLIFLSGRQFFKILRYVNNSQKSNALKVYLDRSDAYVIIFDENGCVYVMSRNAEILLGLECGEASGRPVESLASTDAYAGVFRSALNDLKVAKSAAAKLCKTLPFKLRFGEDKFFKIRLEPAFHKKSNRFEGCFMDIYPTESNDVFTDNHYPYVSQEEALEVASKSVKQSGLLRLSQKSPAILSSLTMTCVCMFLLQFIGEGGGGGIERNP